MRAELPELTLITDVCLCEYTSHGHCGVLRDGEVANDETVELLARVAVSHVAAGRRHRRAERHDGRAGGGDPRRAPRDADRLVRRQVRLRVLRPVSRGRGVDARPRATVAATRWIRRTSARRCANAQLDLDEGADALIVKPALPYLDVIRAVRERFDCPVWAYNVSGEYAMIRAAAAAGHLEEERAVLESLTAIKRAGAGTIITYWAKDVAQWL